MALDVRLSQASLKTFSNAITCLSKIGKDLFIEADHDQLVLRTLNDSKSAFSAFYLNPEEFFDSFACGRDDGTPFSCKIMLKAVQGVLKNIRRVVALRIYLDESGSDGETVVEPHLVFELQSEANIEKRHHLHIQDCEIIQAMFPREGASRLVTPANQFIEMLDHMHGSFEVAFHAERDRVRVKTFRSNDPMGTGTAGERPGAAALSTEMSISSTDFDAYELGETEDTAEVALVFSVKEVKSFLAFCDATDHLKVYFFFHGGGRPVLLAAEDKAMRVELMLSTMEAVDVDSMPMPSRSQRAWSSWSGASVRDPQEQEEEQEQEGQGGGEYEEERYQEEPTPNDDGGQFEGQSGEMDVGATQPDEGAKASSQASTTISANSSRAAHNLMVLRGDGGAE